MTTAISPHEARGTATNMNALFEVGGFKTTLP
jgi:hypothetical protein